MSFYINKKKGFETTIFNINNNIPQWYANESKYLFKEYLDLIDFLNKELLAVSKQVNSK